jgi:hypothetical protein
MRAFGPVRGAAADVSVEGQTDHVEAEMDAALVVTWLVPFAGREKAALDYGVAVNDHWGKLAAEGKCSTPEMFFFPSGSGMWMVKGDLAALEELFWRPESQRLNTKGQLLLQRYRWEFALAGDAADEFMLRYAAAGQELGVL